MKTSLYLVIAFATCLATTPALAQQSSLYMVSNNNSNLYKADTSSATVSNLGGISPIGGGSISQCNGLAVHPCTGEMYAVVNFGSGFGRSIAVIDSNGNALVLGNTNDLVASIAFDDNGTLYAVTGDGANTSETMYTVDLTDGSLTFFQSLGNGSDGEAIAYCTDNGKMYHWSGWSSLAGIVFESIDLNTNTVTNIGMTGSVSPTSIKSATYVGDGVFLVSYHSSNLLATVDTSGAIAATSYNPGVGIKGMAFEGLNQITVGSDKDGLCPGDSATLTASTGLSYQWYLDGNLISGATSQTLPTGIAGQYNCVIQTPLCTDSSSIGVFLDSFNLPVVNLSSSDSGFCPGNVVTVQGSQGGSSQWFLNGDSISGATSNSYLAGQPGWYNMVKVNQDGCADSAAMGLYISEFETPEVNLGPDDGFCAGDSLILDAGAFAGANYFWTPFATTQTYTVTDSGTYSLIVQSAQGCTGGDTVEIELYPLPNVDLGENFVLCANTDTILDAGAGGFSYAWSDGSSGQTNTYNSSVLGTDELVCTVTDANGCQASDTVLITIIEGGPCEVGVNELPNAFGKLFPNPSQGMTTITSTNRIQDLKVYNQLGQLVASRLVNDFTTQLSIQSSGAYTVVLSDGNGNVSHHRLIVE